MNIRVEQKANEEQLCSKSEGKRRATEQARRSARSRLDQSETNERSNTKNDHKKAQRSDQSDDEQSNKDGERRRDFEPVKCSDIGG